MQSRWGLEGERRVARISGYCGCAATPFTPILAAGSCCFGGIAKREGVENSTAKLKTILLRNLREFLQSWKFVWSLLTRFCAGYHSYRDKLLRHPGPAFEGKYHQSKNQRWTFLEALDKRRF